MPSLTQGTGYAATALGYIAAHGGKPVLVRKIAETCDLPAPYLSKVIHRLSRAGLVNTQRGTNGGVTLAAPAGEISLADLCRALDDPILETKCMLGTRECNAEQACPAHDFNVTERARILMFLESTTIADVSAFEVGRRWQNLSSSNHNGGAHHGNGNGNGHGHGHGNGNGHGNHAGSSLSGSNHNTQNHSMDD